MADQQLAAIVGQSTHGQSALDYLGMAYAVALRLAGDRRHAELIARRTIEQLMADSPATTNTQNTKMTVLSLVRTNFLAICGGPLGGASKWPDTTVHTQPAN